MIISELIKDGNNILVKDNLGNQVAVFASNGTYSHAYECDFKTVYLNTSPSKRGIDASKLVIDITAITAPAPPVGGWTQPLFIQELNDNFLNCPLDVNASVNIPVGLATEATLVEVRDKIESPFGDTTSKSTIGLTDVSVIVLTANVLRKESYLVNSTGQTIWVCFGGVAVFGEGIELVKGAIWIEDKYRGVVSAIMNAGQSGNIQVTTVLE